MQERFLTERRNKMRTFQLPTTILTVAILSQSIMAESNIWNYNGTTPNLKELIIGRCWEYRELIPDTRNTALSTSAKCEEVWRVFNKTVAFKHPCSITEASYTELFDLIGIKEDIVDQVMFWSGTRGIVHDLTHVNRKYKTLEDTFPGYIANNLHWCSCSQCASGYNTQDKCESRHSCSPNTKYWSLASRQLAEKASGTVYVMLTSLPKENETSYYNESHFGKTELPAMGKSGKVKKLIIYNMFVLQKKPIELCGTKSLEQLVETVKKHNITDVECHDNPKVVRHVLCTKDPTADQCKFSINSAILLEAVKFHLLAILVAAVISL